LSKFKIALPLLLALPQIAIADLALEEIEVTTPLRVPEEEKNIIADTTVITSDEIKRAGLSSLPQLLQQQPGIEVTNTGGPGKVSSINIRGTSSTHSIILIDGLRVGSSTAGTTAIQDIPLSQIERIEIVRGPVSSLYGQDGIGGVIQIFTKKGKKGFHPYVSAGYGRYQTKEMAAGVSAGNDSTSFALNLAGMNTDAFSAYVPNDNAAANTRNLDDDTYRNRSITSNLTHQFNDKVKIDFQYYLSTGRNMYDNSSANLDATYLNYKDKTKQEAYSTKLSGKINDNWESSLKIGKGTDLNSNQQKWDAGAVVAGMVNKYETSQYQLAWQNNINFDYGSLVLLYDYLKEEIDTTSTSYSKDDRDNNGFVIAYNTKYEKHTLQTSLREDINSQYDNETTGSIGYAYQINNQWKVSSSFGTAFVAPSFNYLYNGSSANPDLKPETSENIEASLKYSDNSTSVSFTAYQNTIDDFIISNPDTGYTPLNLNKAKIQGMTFAADHFLGNFQIKGSVTTESPNNEDTDKDLPLRANLYGSTHLNYYVQDWIFGVEQIGSGSRYNDADNTVKIGGYIVTNLVTNYVFNEKFTVNVRLDNALDKDYALVYAGDPSSTGYAYQTPGRSLSANIRYDF
jgi:vitamin B12 transporter